MSEDFDDGGPATPWEVAVYVREISAELAALSRRAGLAHVAMTLDLAQIAASAALQENAAAEDAA
jgi:hypothetical protein